MQVGVIGMNFKVADLKLREILAKKYQQLSLSFPCVFLNTCNRSEVYFTGDDLPFIHSEIFRYLSDEIPTHKLYSYFEKECFLHLCQVTAGLDSAIFLETEIQRQVKLAYHKRKENYFLPECMHFLFQKSLKVAKSIRNTVKSSKKYSLESSIWCISQFLLKNSRPLFIGFSKTNRQICSYFLRKGITSMAFSSRYASCMEFTKKNHLRFVKWNNFYDYHEYNLIIIASNFDEMILKKEHFLDVKDNVVIFDLSVPRKAEPELSCNPFVDLFDIDTIASPTVHADSKERQECEIILHSHVNRLFSTFEQKQKYKLQTALAL